MEIIDNKGIMNAKTLLIGLLLTAAASLASAQSIAINGVDRDGYGGVYEIQGVGSGFDGGNYWWMCIEPNGSTSAGAGGGFIADAISLTDAWDQQNTERLAFYDSNPGFRTTALPLQVSIMSYVLDTYLPSTPGRYLEHSSSASLYGNDDTFYNSFFVIQNFLAETYGKPTKIDFTDLSDYAFQEGNAAGNPLSIAARELLFTSILTDVADKALNNPTFFDTYTAQGTYLVANTLFSESSPDNWQDALIIMAPVPEPSGALLIACTGLAVMLRRFRRLA
jgi:hypothetical protein